MSNIAPSLNAGDTVNPLKSPGDRPKLRGRPRKADATIIGSDILKVAAGMFGEFGYGGTSMEAVAVNAGISKRTLYLRYSDKKTLFKEVLDSIITNARVPDPREFPDLRTCLTFHVDNFFLICADPGMRVIFSMADNSVQSLPELAALGHELTHELGTKRIAQTIADTATKSGEAVRDPEFIAASLLDLATGHTNRVRVLNLDGDAASPSLAGQRIVNLLMASINADSVACRAD